jgi:ketosteroid isomerase-like protein
MSRENVEIVRQPLAVRADSHRRLEERASLRFPGPVSLLGRAFLRLSPRSRLRQKGVSRLARLFLEAYNRRDFDATYSRYHPDSETIVPHQLVAVGFEPIACGRLAILSFQRRWHADWGEFRIEPAEVIDLGGRVLVLGHIRGSGLSSGAGTDSEWGLFVTIAPNGWIVREQVFFQHAEAVAAAGLRE